MHADAKERDVADVELYEEIKEAQRAGERRVLATVATARGSTPFAN